MIRIDHQNIFWPGQKATGYHPGPVAPPIADGASFEIKQLIVHKISHCGTSELCPVR